MLLPDALLLWYADRLEGNPTCWTRALVAGTEPGLRQLVVALYTSAFFAVVLFFTLVSIRSTVGQQVKIMHSEGAIQNNSRVDVLVAYGYGRHYKIYHASYSLQLCRSAALK